MTPFYCRTQRRQRVESSSASARSVSLLGPMLPHVVGHVGLAAHGAARRPDIVLIVVVTVAAILRIVVVVVVVIVAAFIWQFLHDSYVDARYFDTMKQAKAGDAQTVDTAGHGHSHVDLVLQADRAHEIWIRWRPDVQALGERHVAVQASSALGVSQLQRHGMATNGDIRAGNRATTLRGRTRLISTPSTVQRAHKAGAIATRPPRHQLGLDAI